MRPSWRLAVLGIVCAAATFVVPAPSLVGGREVLFARLAASGLIGLALFALTSHKAANARILGGIMAGSLVAVLLAILTRSWAPDACVGTFQGRPVLVGFELHDYAQHERTLPNDEVLLDAGGDPTRAWTGRSIAACRGALVWSGPLILLFAALGAGALTRALTFPGRLLATKRRPAPPEGKSARWVYDAFISYRHVEPDRAFALEVASRIESQGFRVAIDSRDFRPNEAVVVEQERCIRESRFTLCVISPRYIVSGYCIEEAIVSSTLDLDERRRRLVPLVYERVDLPGWMKGLVGIDFSDPAAFVDPYGRLFDLLRADASGVTGSPA